MPIGLKAYLFWVRGSVPTLHNCWPLSSLRLTSQCCGCNKHVNKYICVYIYTYKFLNAHTYFFLQSSEDPEQCEDCPADRVMF